jgi:GntR family transcriptional regulator
LYKTLEEEYRFNLDWARRTYKAAAANKEVARLLEIEPGAPIMYIEELYHLVGDVPVEYTKVWINAEVFEISTIIRREEEKRDFEVYNE